MEKQFYSKLLDGYFYSEEAMKAEETAYKNAMVEEEKKKAKFEADKKEMLEKITKQSQIVADEQDKMSDMLDKYCDIYGNELPFECVKALVEREDDDDNDDDDDDEGINVECDGDCEHCPLNDGED